MTSVNRLISELDESKIAKEIAIKHDESRMKYSLKKNTVKNFDEFSFEIGKFTAYQVSKCISCGGSLSPDQASSWAKDLLEREYRRHGSNLIGAYNNAHDGTNGGMRAVLDTITDALKAESIERYVRSVFDRHIPPDSWPQKVLIMKQLFENFGTLFPATIRKDQPERYAQNYQELIRGYVGVLRQSSSMFNRF